MPYYKFGPTDKFVNTLKTHPPVKFFFYGGSTWYNNETIISASAYGKEAKLVPPGSISLYEYNIDRSGSDPSPTSTGPNGLPTNAIYMQPDPDPVNPEQNVINSGLIYPFMVKDGSRISFRTVTNLAYNSTDAGAVISASYPYSASVSKEYYPSTLARHIPTTRFYTIPLEDVETGSITHLFALKNTLNQYTYLSRHYEVSSSLYGRDLLASSSMPDAGFDQGGGPGGQQPGTPSTLTAPAPDGGSDPATNVGLLSIPSIFYGDGIKKGTVNLKFYLSGALAGELQDLDHNGELVQVNPPGSAGSGSVAGVVLYNEGFIILTSSIRLGLHINDAHAEEYTEGLVDGPRWEYFAQPISGSLVLIPARACVSSSFSLEFSGTTKIQTITMFAKTNKGELNHSSNPTFLSHSLDDDGNVVSPLMPSTGSFVFKENSIAAIKNIVSSSYNDPTASFQKTTYISKVGIYDSNRNLIAIAKTATPIKKTEERDFVFKLKLDI